MRRSTAALLYLEAMGVDANRMTCEGYGINSLPNRCIEGAYYSDPEHQSNRRAYVHFQEYGN